MSRRVAHSPIQIPFHTDRWEFSGSGSAELLRVDKADNKDVVVEKEEGEEEEEEKKEVLRFVAKGSSDWWRTPLGSEPLDHVNARSGPTLTFALDGCAPSWSAGVWLQCEMDERFKQATLFIHAGQTIGDAESSWLKAGVELDEGRENVGCVVTNPYSDWSTAPSQRSVGLEKAHWLYVQVSRQGPDLSVCVAYSRDVTEAASLPLRPRTSELVQIREVRGFVPISQSKRESDSEKESKSKSQSERESENGKGKGKDTGGRRTQQAQWRIGIMACGPLSTATRANFAKFSLDMAS